MKKSIKLLIACTLYSSGVMAQAGDSVQNVLPEKLDIGTEYGQSISINERESTIASGVATRNDLSRRTSINSSNMLYGLISGLQVLQNAGNSWSDQATLLIRGLGTTNNNAPLIIVDGFERSLDALSPSEIESVSVLKDATSTALYGIRGANGVIYVKTKRGSDSKPVINFSYQYNHGTPNRLPKFVNGHTYANALNEGMANDGLSPRYNSAEVEAFRSGSHPDFYPNVDWINEALRSHSSGDNVNFSAEGGNKSVKYFTQVNFLDDRGILRPTEDNEGYSTQFKYSQLNIRTNLDIRVSKTTNVKLNVFGNFSEYNFTGADKDVFSTLYQVPSGAFPVKTKNGVWGGTTVYDNNPIALISGSGYNRAQRRTAYADLELKQNLDFIINGLSFMAKVGVDYYGVDLDRNHKKFGYQSAEINLATGVPKYTNLRNEGTLGFSKEAVQSTNHTTFATGLNYVFLKDKHKLDAALLFSMDKTNNLGLNTSRAFMDLISQVHYVYDNRYLVDLSLSRSAASVLDPSNRWGIFPALGAGWILSEEDMFKTEWLDFLKVRASYGISGYANYPVKLYYDLYGSTNSYYFKDSPSAYYGLGERQIGMRNLTYEKSNKLNVGIDVTLLKKLSFVVDGYHNHRTDILITDNGTYSSALGISPSPTNEGVVDSYGTELGANWNDQINSFKYQIGGQFSFTRNEVKNMNEVYRPHDYLKATGRPIGQFFGFEVEGIYKDQQEIDNRNVKQYLSEVRPGDFKYKDQNGDDRIDDYDKIALGYNNYSPEIYYSFNLGAEYKGIGFYALFQGVGNYSTILNSPSLYRPLINNSTISQEYYDNRWTKENPNAKYPRLTTTGSANNFATNSAWVADASYLKLRTLEVYYNLPGKLVGEGKRIKNAKLFARAHDLLLWDKIKEIDPEFVGATHPTMTQYTFGFNLSF